MLICLFYFLLEHWCQLIPESMGMGCGGGAHCGLAV